MCSEIKVQKLKKKYFTKTTKGRFIIYGGGGGDFFEAAPKKVAPLENFLVSFLPETRGKNGFHGLLTIFLR